MNEATAAELAAVLKGWVALDRENLVFARVPVCSPLLANTLLDHILDEWFEREVKPRMKGRGLLIRVAGDCVIGCARRCEGTTSTTTVHCPPRRAWRASTPGRKRPVLPRPWRARSRRWRRSVVPRPPAVCGLKAGASPRQAGPGLARARESQEPPGPAA
jgi:hypothetical protein